MIGLLPKIICKLGHTLSILKIIKSLHSLLVFKVRPQHYLTNIDDKASNNSQHFGLYPNSVCCAKYWPLKCLSGSIRSREILLRQEETALINKLLIVYQALFLKKY